MARFDVTGVQTLRAVVAGEGAAPGGSRQQLPGGCQLLRQGLVQGGDTLCCPGTVGESFHKADALWFVSCRNSVVPTTP